MQVRLDELNERTDRMLLFLAREGPRSEDELCLAHHPNVAQGLFSKIIGAARRGIIRGTLNVLLDAGLIEKQEANGAGEIRSPRFTLTSLGIERLRKLDPPPGGKAAPAVGAEQPRVAHQRAAMSG